MPPCSEMKLMYGAEGDGTAGYGSVSLATGVAWTLVNRPSEKPILSSATQASHGRFIFCALGLPLPRSAYISFTSAISESRLAKHCLNCLAPHDLITSCKIVHH
jgi:hypothetical protein